jgi:hypothetical protein
MSLMNMGIDMDMETTKMPKTKKKKIDFNKPFEEQGYSVVVENTTAGLVFGFNSEDDAKGFVKEAKTVTGFKKGWKVNVLPDNIRLLG